MDISIIILMISGIGGLGSDFNIAFFVQPVSPISVLRQFGAAVLQSKIKQPKKGANLPLILNPHVSPTPLKLLYGIGLIGSSGFRRSQKESYWLTANDSSAHPSAFCAGRDHAKEIDVTGNSSERLNSIIKGHLEAIPESMTPG